MKILYVTPERHAAQLAVHALRGVAPNCTVAWARTFDSALRWMQENADAAAVILDRAGDAGSSARFLEQVAGVNSSAAIMIGSPLKLVAIGGAVRQQILAQGRREAEQRHASDLASAESRLAELQALHGATKSRDARICTALQERLFELEAALVNAEERYATLEERRASDSSAATARARELEDALLKAHERYASLEQTRSSDASAAAARTRELETAHAKAQESCAMLEDALLKAHERHLALEQLRAADASAAAAREREVEAKATAKRRRTIRAALGLRRRSRHSRMMLEAHLARDRQAHVQVVAARDEEIARLQQGLRTFRDELEKLRADAASRRREAEALRRDAEELPHVRLQLEESERERHRQFEDAPYAVCRCTREGRITHLNEAFVTLLGYRRADELRRVDLSSLLECADDLRWVIERSLGTRTTESVETTVKTPDHRRLHVRLRARATPDGAVELAVHDATTERELQRRLAQAQRMEAVGRLAAEVAETCDALLSDVTRGGRQWLTSVSADPDLRHRGELLFGDVARAASFLRQFAVYGDRQINALEPVNVQRTLHGLEPVLKRVAGDDIKIVLPKAPMPLEVDVDADRLERILVNVASYARERLPYGGTIDVDLTSTTVDRRFIATYPGVRPGAHVLITVNHVPRPARQVIPPQLQHEHETANRRTLSDKPGVDLGVLLELIRDSEGHLWITAEPSGNMTLKIYLPCRDADSGPELAASASRPGRARPLARLFRH